MVQTAIAPRVRVIPATQTETGRETGRRRKKRVAAYCRVSTDSAEQLNSYAAQQAYYAQKIEENPEWENAGIFADEGISGTSLKKRQEFNRMIEACKRGRIDMILTKSLSRFSRNTVDCLETVRMLKSNGIGVIFEKENINTLTETSEFLITLFSGFAQAESESLSKNVTWGKQKSMEAGNVPMQYSKMIGYRKGLDGKPEIVPEEAALVRRIYKMYLDGSSLVQITKTLIDERIPTATGIGRWSPQVVRNILTNEKYIGDALLQKTYITDCISKRVKKNCGERPMYYVENHHAAIIPKEVFGRVREEMTRRSSKRKVMQKTGKTEQGKYSSKYALTERLVCGECGTPYKRVTWTAKNGKKHIVWRCISRLEFGKRYCHNSPSVDEGKLHAAVVAALNTYADQQEAARAAQEFAQAVQNLNDAFTNLIGLKQRLHDITAEQDKLVDLVLMNMEDAELTARLKAVTEEKDQLVRQIESLQADSEQQAADQKRAKELETWLAQHPSGFSEYSDALTRKFIEKITVLDKEMIRVRFRDGGELEKIIPCYGFEG